MVPSDLFRDQPTLHGRGVRLVPLGAENADDFIQGIIDLDPQVRRLTGTHRTFTEVEPRAFAASRPDHHDRGRPTHLRRRHLRR